MYEYYSNLIIKYLQDTLSDDETDVFYRWVNADVSHKKMFFEMKTVFDACRFSDRPMTDAEKSWKRLLYKRRRAAHTDKSYMKILRFPGVYKKIWGKVALHAAIALLAISVTSAFFIFTKDNPEMLAPRYIGGNGLEADVILLPDESRVSLGSKTTFYFNPDYGGTERNVYLEGEAYFEVKQQKEKPFIVNINGMKIEALGTAFNVMAYPGDSLFMTTLLEGSVRLTTTHNAREVVLKPNQQLVFNRNNREMQVHNVDANAYIAWVTGYYYFYEQNLKSILHRLSYIYGVTFEVKSEKLNNTVFTGTFYRGQSAKSLMEIINLSVPVKYKIKDHHVIICE
ncbi:MAG: DUF4974 domain-containing protein [Tannerella sp.]|jgi:ferric-dicitrate binding protein FerR (iron transport regulator)|nr:DUF4974 domain-containing protein [Tannerella sp.]